MSDFFERLAARLVDPGPELFWPPVPAPFSPQPEIGLPPQLLAQLRGQQRPPAAPMPRPTLRGGGDESRPSSRSNGPEGTAEPGWEQVPFEPTAPAGAADQRPAPQRWATVADGAARSSTAGGVDRSVAEDPWWWAEVATSSRRPEDSTADANEADAAEDDRADEGSANVDDADSAPDAGAGADGEGQDRRAADSGEALAYGPELYGAPSDRRSRRHAARRGDPTPAPATATRESSMPGPASGETSAAAADSADRADHDPTSDSAAAGHTVVRPMRNRGEQRLGPAAEPGIDRHIRSPEPRAPRVVQPASAESPPETDRATPDRASASRAIEVEGSRALAQNRPSERSAAEAPLRLNSGERDAETTAQKPTTGPSAPRAVQSPITTGRTPVAEALTPAVAPVVGTPSTSRQRPTPEPTRQPTPKPTPKPAPSRPDDRTNGRSQPWRAEPDPRSPVGVNSAGTAPAIHRSAPWTAPSPRNESRSSRRRDRDAVPIEVVVEIEAIELVEAGYRAEAQRERLGRAPMTLRDYLAAHGGR